MDLYEFREAVTRSLDKYDATVSEARSNLESELRMAKDMLIGENVPKKDKDYDTVEPPARRDR